MSLPPSLRAHGWPSAASFLCSEGGIVPPDASWADRHVPLSVKGRSTGHLVVGPAPGRALQTGRSHLFVEVRSPATLTSLGQAILAETSYDRISGVRLRADLFNLVRVRLKLLGIKGSALRPRRHRFSANGTDRGD